MRGTIGSELLKLRKRPAFWILLAILLLVVVAFGYLFLYILVLTIADEMPGMAPEAVRAGLLPDAIVPTTLSQLTGFGGAIALILGVLVAGSEYGWSTWKTTAVQGPSRTTLMGGKLISIGLALVGFVVVTMVASWAASLLIAAIEGTDRWLPPVGELFQGLGAGWLMLATYAALGVLLAVLMRGVGLALGIGLVYVLVLESIMLAIPLPDRLTEIIQQLFISSNAVALSQWFGFDPSGMGGPMMDVGPVQAAAVLAAYVAVCAVATIAIFRARAIE